MKKLLLPLLLLLLSAGLFAGESIKLDSTLPRPDSIRYFRDPGELTTPFKKLLDDGRLLDFYNAAYVELERLGKARPSVLNGDDLKHQFWLFYYIAATPMMTEKDLTTHEYGRPSINVNLQDFETKELSLLVIPRVRHHFKRLTKECSTTPRELTALLAAYSAGTRKRFHEVYIPGKFWKLATLPDYPKPVLDKNRTYTPKEITDLEALARQRHMWERHLQERTGFALRLSPYKDTFIELLVDFFPDNAAEVKKYIKLGGYTDKEIPDLIDDTVGRTPKTEYLYKGRKKSPPKKYDPSQPLNELV